MSMSDQTPIIVIPEPEPIRERLAALTQERATLRTLLRLAEQQRRRQHEQSQQTGDTNDNNRR